MSTGTRRWSVSLAVVLGLLTMAAAAPLAAAVPNEDAAPAYAEEQTILQLEQGLREPGMGSIASGIRHFDRHYIAPPGRMTEQDVILQRGGNTWREIRNGPLAVSTAALLVGVLFLIAAFYRIVGPARTEEPESGHRIVRFTRYQRLVHWSTAITFVVLALTGLIILFGKKLMLPWMGPTVFSWFAIVSKYLHNIAGPLFVVFAIAMVVAFARYNTFRRWDWLWLRKVGGMISHEHVPAGYFNAGEKIFFWGFVALMSVVIGVSGLMLDFPYTGQVGAPVGFTRYLLQWANYVHLAAAALYITAVIGHAYLGTLGTPGAWTAMRQGTVDESWARAHHSIWYEEVRRGGAQPSPGVQPLRGRLEPGGRTR